MLLTMQFMSFQLRYYMPMEQPFPYRDYFWLMSLGAITVGSFYFLFKFFVKDLLIELFNKSVRRGTPNV